MTWLTGKQYALIAGISLVLTWSLCIVLIPAGVGFLGSIILLIVVSMLAAPPLFLVISAGYMLIKYIRRALSSHT